MAKGRKKPKLLPSSFSDAERLINILCWGTAQFRDVNVIGFEQEEEAGSGGANGSRNLGTLSAATPMRAAYAVVAVAAAQESVGQGGYSGF